MDRIDPITEAAKLARTLFLLNEWTWHWHDGCPTQREIEATFSSLKWDIERLIATDPSRGERTLHGRTGRLQVVRDSDGSYTYNVHLATEYAPVVA